MMVKRSFGGLALSIAEILVGILLLINPVGFTSGIIIAGGTVMVLMGLADVVKYFCLAPEAAAASQFLVKGVVMLLAGGFCVLRSCWFIATFPVLTLVYGVLVLIGGITKVQWTLDMIRLGREKWFWVAISAVISVACGILIIASPFDSTAVLWMFIGISLIVESALDMIGSIFGNRAKQGDPEETAGE